MTLKKKLPPDAVDKQIGIRLKALRKSRRYSQADVGKALGVSFQQIQKYENGSNKLRPSQLIAASEFYAVPIDYFFRDLVGAPDLERVRRISERSSNDLILLENFHNTLPRHREIIRTLANDLASAFKHLSANDA